MHQFVVQVLLLPLVLILGDGDRATGFEKTVTIFDVVGVIIFHYQIFNHKRTYYSCQRTGIESEAGLKRPFQKQTLDCHANSNRFCFHKTCPEKRYVCVLL